MNKLKSEEFLVIATVTMVVAFLWIFLSVMGVSVKPDKPVLTSQETRPIDPKLDKTVFDDLATRRQQ